MTYEEALNKMHDYGLDDEGDEAVEKLSEALEVLRILKKYIHVYAGEHEAAFPYVYCGDLDGSPSRISMLRSMDEYEAIKNWLEEEK